MRQTSDFSQLVIDGSRQDADQITDVLSRRYAPTKIEPLKGAERLQLRSLHGTLPGIRLTRGEFANGALILPQARYDAVAFVLPTAGQTETREGRGSFSAGPGTVLAIDGTECRSLRLSPGLKKYGIAIDRGLIVRRLSMLLDRPVSDDIVFAPLADARSIRYEAMSALLACVTSDAFGISLSGSPYTAARMQGVLVDFVLETWPHSHAADFHREPLLIAPRYVKAAIDYIEAHPLAPRSAEEIAKLCGVSLRALQYGFRRFAGASITEYQRRVRLQRARSDMLASPDSVEAVALRWGFTNAGRFSRHFKATFGMSPSELRRT